MGMPILHPQEQRTDFSVLVYWYRHSISLLQQTQCQTPSKSVQPWTLICSGTSPKPTCQEVSKHKSLLASSGASDCTSQHSSTHPSHPPPHSAPIPPHQAQLFTHFMTLSALMELLPLNRGATECPPAS